MMVGENCKNEKYDIFNDPESPRLCMFGDIYFAPNSFVHKVSIPSFVVVEGRDAAKKLLKGMDGGDMKEVIIENIITHGRAGTVNGTMTFTNDTKFGFCDVFEFTTHAKDAKIKSLTSYVVSAKK